MPELGTQGLQLDPRLGTFQVPVPEGTSPSWRFSRQLEDTRQGPGFPRTLEALFCPFTASDAWGLHTSTRCVQQVLPDETPALKKFTVEQKQERRWAERQP